MLSNIARVGKVVCAARMVRASPTARIIRPYSTGSNHNEILKQSHLVSSDKKIQVSTPQTNPAPKVTGPTFLKLKIQNEIYGDFMTFDRMIQTEWRGDLMKW